MSKIWTRNITKKTELAQVVLLEGWTKHSIINPFGTDCLDPDAEVRTAHNKGLIYRALEIVERGVYVIKTKEGAVWYETRSRDMVTGKPIPLPKLNQEL